MENIRNVSPSDCDFSPLDSILMFSILNDLERHLVLIKLASEKTEHEGSLGLTNRPEEQGNEVSKMSASTNSAFLNAPLQQSNPDNLPEDVRLEANLEYDKLHREFSTLQLRKGSNSSVISSRRNANINLPNGFLQNMDYIVSVIHKTKESVHETNNFSILKEEIEKANSVLNQTVKLKADIKGMEQMIAKMKKDLHKTKQEISIEEQFKTGEINRLKDEHHLTKQEGKDALQVTDLYFKAQSCNMESNYREKVEETTKDINESKRQIDRDVHCLAVMACWTDDFCEQLEKKISEWKLKFRRDEFAMEMRIDAKRKAIKTQEELIKSLNETIAERLEELAPWEEEKEVERQERLAHMRRYYSARKIQRWWRGYMVKLKLYKRRKVKARPVN